MMHLFITVLAIALASLLVLGGINYISTDMGIKTELKQALFTHHDAYRSGAVSYRVSNNGINPTDLDQLVGFMPGGQKPEFPRGRSPLEWTLESGKLCLRRTASGETADLEAFLSFARSRAAVETVTYGTDCAEAVAPGSLTIDADFDMDYLSAQPDAAIVFERF